MARPASKLNLREEVDGPILLGDNASVAAWPHTASRASVCGRPLPWCNTGDVVEGPTGNESVLLDCGQGE